MLKSSIKNTAFLPSGTILFLVLLINLDSIKSYALAASVLALKTKVLAAYESSNSVRIIFNNADLPVPVIPTTKT